MQKIIVVSAINILEGGPLTILNDCLSYLSDNLSSDYRIIALVHEIKNIKAHNVECITYPRSRERWLYRLYYEYYQFKSFSREIKPFLWFSLHDITPNVDATIRAVYCHNPSPFYSFSLNSLWYNYQVALFSLFYKYLYRFNIHKNDYVVVQQDWIRNAFQKMYDLKKVIVAYPEERPVTMPAHHPEKFPKKTFLYPAFPRVFKNIEGVAEAARILHTQGREDFQFLLTINGTENRYASHIVGKYKNVPTISFIGLKSREEIFHLYSQIDGLIFPSKLETWGLPISEFKTFGKPMFLADLPYAHETIGDFEKVVFFDPEKPQTLTRCIAKFLDDELEFTGNRRVEVNEPFARNWKELFEILLNPKS